MEKKREVIMRFEKVEKGYTVFSDEKEEELQASNTMLVDIFEEISLYFAGESGRSAEEVLDRLFELMRPWIDDLAFYMVPNTHKNQQKSQE